MSRRKFLKGSGVVALAGIATAGTRLYGEPASVKPRAIADREKFMLPLARAAVPTELWRDLSGLGVVWENVLTNDTEASDFFANPSSYLTKFGLDGSDRSVTSDTVWMLRAMADPAVKDGLKSGDYQKVFSVLTHRGFLENVSEGSLSSRIESVFRENLDKIKSEIALGSKEGFDGFIKNLKNSDLPITDEDLVTVGALFQNPSAGPTPNCFAFALCVVAVGIAATVIAYVSVVVAVTVGVLAAIFVSLGVSTAVTVSGGGGICPPNCPIKVEGFSPPFTGKYVQLDPAAIRNYERVLRLGLLTSDGGLQLHAARSLIELEVKTVFAALQNVGLIAVPSESMEQVLDGVVAYAWKCTGLVTKAV